MRASRLHSSAVAAATLGALALYSRLARLALRHNLAQLRAGDSGPLLRFYADDVHFRFPGDSSWAGEVRGKPELERWLRRFIDAGLQIYADEIVVKGPPWKTTVIIRGTDHARDGRGEIVYENRVVIWGTASWGKVRRYEVYEDTQKTAALDEYLASLD
jgi:ketosteroid isomerase-like protein